MPPVYFRPLFHKLSGVFAMKPYLFVSPWAALAAGLLLYLSDERTLRLLLPPVLFHELGHVLALRLCGCRIRALRLELGGLCLDYSGDPPLAAQLFCALAGPLAGLLYALPVARLGPDGSLSAGISLLLSGFNLIPALPLDGGRALEAVTEERTLKVLSLLSASLTAAAGLVLLYFGKGAALAFAGGLLLAAQLRSSAISPD